MQESGGLTPGPSVIRSKARGPVNSEPPVNVMNPVSPPGTSLITPVPAKDGPIVSRALTLLLRFVAAETWRHAGGSGDPEFSGSQSMAVRVTLIPPPLQFATDRWPMIEAEADGANVAQASMAKLKTPAFSTFRFFNFDLRKYRATI